MFVQNFQNKETWNVLTGESGAMFRGFTVSHPALCCFMSFTAANIGDAKFQSRLLLSCFSSLNILYIYIQYLSLNYYFFHPN